MAATIAAILKRVFIRSITSVELEKLLQGMRCEPYEGVKHKGREFVAGLRGNCGRRSNGAQVRRKRWRPRILMRGHSRTREHQFIGLHRIMQQVSVVF